MVTIAYCRQEESGEDMPGAAGTGRDANETGRGGGSYAGKNAERDSRIGKRMAVFLPSGLRDGMIRITKVIRAEHTRKEIRKAREEGRRGILPRHIEPAQMKEMRLPGGRIRCYSISRDLRRAALQLARLEEERLGQCREDAPSGIWLEEGLAERLGLRQPELNREELIWAAQSLCRGAFGTGVRRESMLVVAPEDEQAGEAFWYEELLMACMEDLNRFTICTGSPQYYARMAEEAMEKEGLAIRFMEELPKGYPLGRHLIILNCREGYRMRRSLLGEDTIVLTVSPAGFVKFLDTTVKNSYNIYS